MKPNTTKSHPQSATNPPEGHKWILNFRGTKATATIRPDGDVAVDWVPGRPPESDEAASKAYELWMRKVIQQLANLQNRSLMRIEEVIPGCGIWAVLNPVKPDASEQ